MQRREFLKAAAAALPLARAAGSPQAKRPTRFQIACMTLPYSQFPLERALKGIQGAGYKYVAWGTTHAESAGERVPVIALDAPPQKAKDLAARCRDLGLEPLMMFSMVYPEAKEGLEVLTQRIRQAAAGGIPQVLSFGHTEGGDRKLWIERFRKLGPIARSNNVLIVVKQHGGTTGTGEVCAETIREGAEEGVKVNCDACIVMDSLHVDPI